MVPGTAALRVNNVANKAVAWAMKLPGMYSHATKIPGENNIRSNHGNCADDSMAFLM